MRLHENKTLFQQAIRATAQKMNIPDIFIEKDYWVTYALHIIFTNEVGDYTVFKGGTALSKCFNMIERFSEDIDLVVLRNEGETSGQLTKKIRNISKKVGEYLPEFDEPGITNKKGNIRKTAHQYSKVFKGTFGQVRDFIVLEATWLGRHEPYTQEVISSYIHDMMFSTDQGQMIEQYNLLPFNAKVLDPKRTLCEKIMSLVRFSDDKDPIVSLRLKVRHIYDLHQMLKINTLKAFFDSQGFLDMIIRVAKDDVVSFKNNNDWLKYHPSKAVIFGDLEMIWSQLTSTYNNEFSDLIYGILPNEEDVLSTMKSIKSRVDDLDWSDIEK